MHQLHAIGIYCVDDLQPGHPFCAGSNHHAVHALDVGMERKKLLVNFGKSLHFIFQQFLPGFNLVIIEAFTETAECTITDWLFLIARGMQSVFVTYITANRLQHFIVGLAGHGFKHHSTDNEINRRITSCCRVLAIEDGKSLFVDRREDHVCEIFGKRVLCDTFCPW